MAGDAGRRSTAIVAPGSARREIGGGRTEAIGRKTLGMSIRLLLLIAVALGLADRGRAPAYPDRPIRIVVPFPSDGPGSGGRRAVGPELGQRLGQQVVIDNVAGRDGVVGTDLVARAPPDGYTLLITPSSFAIHPGTFGKLPYDSESAFAAISLLVVAQYALVVNPSLPVEFGRGVDRLRQEPSRQAALCLGRRRRPEPARFRIVQDHQRRRHRPCAVRRRRAGRWRRSPPTRRR